MVILLIISGKNVLKTLLSQKMSLLAVVLDEHHPVGKHGGQGVAFLQTDNHAAFRVDRHDVDAFGQLQNLVVVHGENSFRLG